MTSVLFDMNLGPIEIGPGRGDLQYSSVPAFSGFPGDLVPGARRVSFARLFATQPMVGAAILWLLAESIRVPLKVYRRTGEDSRVQLRNGEHPLATAIAEPWERAGTAQLVMALLGSLSVHGNAIAEIDQGANDKLLFRPADYRFSAPIRPFRDSIAGWQLDSDSEMTRRTVGVDTVLHVSWWSPLGPLGVSPLQQLGVTMDIERAAQRHTEAMLRNQARPPSALTTSPDFLGLDAGERTALMAQLREDVEMLYSGPHNAGRPAILPPGLDWKQVGHTAVEAQLIEQRQVTRDEIGAIYRIMPGCFGFGLDTAGRSLSDQRQASYVDGLMPPLILIEQIINSQVVRALLREDDVYCEFDAGGILRGDRLAEVEALRESIASAMLTPNEGRSIMNMPRSTDDGMDDFYLPRNNLVKVNVPYDGNPAGSGNSGDTSLT